MKKFMNFKVVAIIFAAVLAFSSCKKDDKDNGSTPTPKKGKDSTNNGGETPATGDYVEMTVADFLKLGEGDKGKKVMIKDVQFKDKFLGQKIDKSQWLTTCDGKEFNAWSADSKLNGQPVPEKNGTIKGVVGFYNGRPQVILDDISGMTADRCTVTVAPVEPVTGDYKEMTVTEFLKVDETADKGKKVMIKGVQFKDKFLGKTIDGSQWLTDCDANEFNVYSGKSRLKGQPVPDKNGAIKGVVGFYKGKPQIVLDDVTGMTAERCNF